MKVPLSCDDRRIIALSTVHLKSIESIRRPLSPQFTLPVVQEQPMPRGRAITDTDLGTRSDTRSSRKMHFIP